MKCMKCLGSEPDYLMEDFPEVKICPNCGKSDNQIWRLEK